MRKAEYLVFKNYNTVNTFLYSGRVVRSYLIRSCTILGY